MNIAAVVKDLSISQNSFYMIKEFNKLIDNTDISVGAFFRGLQFPLLIHFLDVKWRHSSTDMRVF